MSRIIGRNHKYFFLSFLVLFFLGGRPVEFGQEKILFQEFLIPKPVIRIALGLNLEDVQIHASLGMKTYRVAENYKLLAEDASEVRVGDFLIDGAAPGYIKTLNPLGFPEAGIIREKVPERTSKPQLVMVNDELVDLDEGTSLYFIPANPQSYLTYSGKNYRGIFVLRGSLDGTILVNVLNLEDYLKSVVPGELSPYYFGEIEALKAQAIAARSYALKNLGQFGDLGFDLYATPQSQVYEGMSLEHPLSSRAVEETKREVAVYDGQIINALYTSTCGGATENAEAMFGGNAVPYLKSIECVMENERVWTLQTGQSLPTYFVGGGLDSSVSFSLSLDLEPGDDVQWIEHEGQVRLLQVQSIPLASVLDQPFHYNSWQVRTSREDLEARLNEYYPIGKLIDLVPQKRGASERVIELSVIGRESQVLVTGLKIRQVLNLRDNLFVIDRETDEEGQPTHFIFSGRGWGHGVGLCQVGAFLMAQNGATYEEILKNYYHGIKIEKRTGY